MKEDIDHKFHVMVEGDIVATTESLESAMLVFAAAHYYVFNQRVSRAVCSLYSIIVAGETFIYLFT